MISREVETPIASDSTPGRIEHVSTSRTGEALVEAVTRQIVGKLVTVITSSGVSITGVAMGVCGTEAALTLNMPDASLPFSSIRLLSLRS